MDLTLVAVSRDGVCDVPSGPWTRDKKVVGRFPEYRSECGCRVQRHHGVWYIRSPSGHVLYRAQSDAQHPTTVFEWEWEKHGSVPNLRFDHCALVKNDRDNPIDNIEDLGRDVFVRRAPLAFPVFYRSPHSQRIVHSGSRRATPLATCGVRYCSLCDEDVDADNFCLVHMRCVHPHHPRPGYDVVEFLA